MQAHVRFETTGVITSGFSKCFNHRIVFFFIGIFIEIELIKLNLGVSQPPGSYNNCKYLGKKILAPISVPRNYQLFIVVVLTLNL